MLVQERGSIWNRGVGGEQVLQGLVGARVAGAKKGEHLTEAGLDPDRFMWALGGLREELDCSARPVPKQLEPSALKGDVVADQRKPSMGQVEL